MDMHNLIHMANQIGSFYEAMPDQEEALLGISGHLHNFWEPRMRKQLLEYVDAEAGKELKPIVLSAIRAHRNQLSPRP
ncbi:MAG: formate dehydrogenase subunit delta [Gallionella sp.]|nr:formate dehydrogenase subunit delta [Gallionella sp.]